MADKTKIEWSDATWNPVTGCTRVSPGCGTPRFEGDKPGGCYAEALAERFRGTSGHYYEHGFDVQLRPDMLDRPLRWKKPRLIFVNSMSDLFHDSIPDDYIARVFAVMAVAKQHTFQVLTKRHGRMRSLLNSGHFVAKVWGEVDKRAPGVGAQAVMMWPSMPLPNVWIGVSVESQQWADIRIPPLLETPAAVRWISAEPLLGPVDLDEWLPCVFCTAGVVEDQNWSPEFPRHRRSIGDGYIPCAACNLGNWEERTRPALSWIVAGGESGPGARPMHPEWARSLRDQCQQASVPFLFKQWGAWVPSEGTSQYPYRDGAYAWIMPDGSPGEPGAHGGVSMCRVSKKYAGRELDGRTWDEFPQAVSA
jgi:protein gp37